MAQKTQSPINLQAHIFAKEELDLQLNWDLKSGDVSRSQHGLEISFPPEKNNYATLNGKNFLLIGMHFHHPSEHYLDGDRYDGELHIVHQNLDDLSYLVIGVFLEVNGDDKKELSRLTTFAKSVKANRTKREKVEVHAEDWVTTKKSKFLRYEGSLTTEPYTETVSWAVLKESKKISQEIFGFIFGDSEPHARALQPLNRRYVVEYDWHTIRV